MLSRALSLLNVPVGLHPRHSTCSSIQARSNMGQYQVLERDIQTRKAGYGCFKRVYHLSPTTGIRALCFRSAKWSAILPSITEVQSPVSANLVWSHLCTLQRVLFARLSRICYSKQKIHFILRVVLKRSQNRKQITSSQASKNGHG